MEVEQIVTVIVGLVGYLVAWFKAREVKKVQDFFDPESTVVAVPKNTPPRSYYMSESVKQFILSDAAPDERGDIYRQIQDAEAKMDETGNASPYVIQYKSGRWYLISFGQIAGGGSPGAPVPVV